MRVCGKFLFITTGLVLLSISISGTISDESECSFDDNCSKYHKCYESQCVDACMRLQIGDLEPQFCGINTYCALGGKRHMGVCKCKRTYEGDPYVGCTKKSD